MSLDNKLRQESFIEKVDNKLLELYQNIGHTWQNRTYKSKKILEGSMYGTSSLLWGIHTMYFGNIAAGVCSFFTGANTVASWCEPKTNGYKGIDLETDYSKFAKAEWALYLAVALIASEASIGKLIHAAITDGDYSTGLKWLSGGLASLTWASANYISRINIEEPPKKPKKKPVFERLKEKIEFLTPKPVPHPVPAEIN